MFLIINIIISIINQSQVLILHSACSSTFELELTVPDLSALSVGGSGVYMGGSKQQGYLHCLVIYTLEGTAYVDGQLAQLANICIVYKAGVLLLSAIEYNPHDSLSGSHRTVGLDMHLINPHSFSFPHEGIKDVFTEVFSLNNDLLLLSMSVWIIGSQCVYPVGHL